MFSSTFYLSSHCSNGRIHKKSLCFPQLFICLSTVVMFKFTKFLFVFLKSMVNSQKNMVQFTKKLYFSSTFYLSLLHSNGWIVFSLTFLLSFLCSNSKFIKKSMWSSQLFICLPTKVMFEFKKSTHITFYLWIYNIFHQDLNKQVYQKVILLLTSKWKISRREW